MSQHAIELGDVVEVLKGYQDNSFDACLTDPPYFLEFMGKKWDSADKDVPVNEALFRSWFAGLVAGEGYFRIHKQKDGAYYACHFGIHMRADEAPLLRALHARMGIGNMKEEGAVTGKTVDSAPSIRWIVESRADCLKLAAILDGSPLYGKKQREYDLWRKALDSWVRRTRGNRWTGPGDNSELEAAYQEMKTLRPFDQTLADSLFDPFAGSSYGLHYAWAKEVLRVLKPGAALIAFSGTRTYHRLACAVEDAGFELRDQLAWMFGTGFPKSLNLDGTHKGYGTALKPAFEPAVLARKPLEGTVAANVAKWGVGALAIDACRIGDEVRINPPAGNAAGGNSLQMSVHGMPQGVEGREAVGRWPANVILDEEAGAALDAQTGNRPGMSGGGKHKAGAAKGMFGAIDGNDSHARGDNGGASRFFYCAKANRKERDFGCAELPLRSAAEMTDSEEGQARLDSPRTGAGRTGGARNHHPTVKPIALMTYLARLLLPPKPGAILVPFSGSGSEMLGCLAAGWPAVLGIERESEYVEIARARLKARAA